MEDSLLFKEEKSGLKSLSTNHNRCVSSKIENHDNKVNFQDQANDEVQLTSQVVSIRPDFTVTLISENKINSAENETKEDIEKFSYTLGSWGNSHGKFLPVHSLVAAECKKDKEIECSSIFPVSVENNTELTEIKSESKQVSVKMDPLWNNYGSQKDSELKLNYCEEDSEAFNNQNIRTEMLLSNPTSAVMNLDGFELIYDPSVQPYVLQEGTDMDYDNFDKLPPLSLSTNYCVSRTSDHDNDISNINRCRRVSHEPRICNACGRTFKYPSDLKKHVQIHSEVKKFECPHCARTFRRLHQLNVHLRIHTGEKPYICGECGMSFRHDSTLTMHIRTRHDKVKPFSCDICGKPFGRLSHLRKHQKYVCASSRKQARIIVNSQMSPAQILPSLICNECGLLFTDSSAYKHHCQHCNRKIFRQDISNLTSDVPNLYDSINQNNHSARTCCINFSPPYDINNHLTTQSNYNKNNEADQGHIHQDNLEVFEAIYQNVIGNHSNVQASMSDLGYSLFEPTDTFLNRDSIPHQDSKSCLDAANSFINSSSKMNDSHQTAADIGSLIDDANFGMKSEYPGNTDQ